MNYSKNVSAYVQRTFAAVNDPSLRFSCAVPPLLRALRPSASKTLMIEFTGSIGDNGRACIIARGKVHNVESTGRSLRGQLNTSCDRFERSILSRRVANLSSALDRSPDICVTRRVLRIKISKSSRISSHRTPRSASTMIMVGS